MITKGKKRPCPQGPAPKDAALVAVIGAGMSGLMSAWRLAMAGYSVTVIEQGGIAHGSTQRSAGCSRQQFDCKEAIIQTRFSTACFEQWQQIMGVEDGVLTQNGYLYPYARGDEAAFAKAIKAFDLQRSLGLHEVQLLDARELKTQFPELIMEDLLGGTFCPTDGFVRAQEAAQDIYHACQRLGVRFILNAKVISSTVEQGAITSLIYQKNGEIGDVQVDKVVLATNAWTHQVAPSLGLDGAFDREVEVETNGRKTKRQLIEPWKRYLAFLQGINKNGNNYPITLERFATRPMYVFPNGLYGHPEGVGQSMDEKHAQFMMGWAAKPDRQSPRDFPDDWQDEIERGFHHKEGGDSYPLAMWCEYAKWVNFVGEMGGVSSTTCGLYGRTPDDSPIIGYAPSIENLILAVGFSGHGVMVGPATGEMVWQLAEQGRKLSEFRFLIRGEDFTIPASSFAIDRDYHPKGTVI